MLNSIKWWPSATTLCVTLGMSYGTVFWSAMATAYTSKSVMKMSDVSCGVAPVPAVKPAHALVVPSTSGMLMLRSSKKRMSSM